MNQRYLTAGLAAVMAFSTAASVTSYASTSLELRKKVVQAAGIMSPSNMENYVTRAEFAGMLVRASEYREQVTQSSSVSVFTDVPKESEYASYIKIAAENNWMSAYLGGNFKPDQYITLQEAAKGIMTLLGYTNEDFTGNQLNARMAKFTYLELNDGINKQNTEVLTREDCVNLFYNLLRTEKKDSGQIYGTVLGCTLTSDGEINPMEMVDNSLKGPVVITKSRNFADIVPFETSTANCYLNGSATTLSNLKSVLNDYGYLVVYYNTSSKSIWAYSENEDATSGRVVMKGEIANIYYQNSEVLTPSKVEIYTEDGTTETFSLNNSEIQFAFSIYGDVTVGDDIILICEKNTSEEGTASYSIVDFLLD